MGQTHVQKFILKLVKQIESGKLNPKLIITHTMRLENAVEGTKFSIRKSRIAGKQL